MYLCMPAYKRFAVKTSQENTIQEIVFQDIIELNFSRVQKKFELIEMRIRIESVADWRLSKRLSQSIASLALGLYLISIKFFTCDQVNLALFSIGQFFDLHLEPEVCSFMLSKTIT